MMNDNESRTALSALLLLPNGSVLPNRLVKAATSELLADTYNRATRAHETLYDTWARGGPGLLLTGNVQIDYRHLEHPGNVVIQGQQDAEHVVRLRAWSGAAKGYGVQVWMQLSHADRQTNRWVNPTPFAPSAVPLNIPGVKFGTPVALGDAQIRELIARFAEAAVVARETGFDGVQLHVVRGFCWRPSGQFGRRSVPTSQWRLSSILPTSSAAGLPSRSARRSAVGWTRLALISSILQVARMNSQRLRASKGRNRYSILTPVTRWGSERRISRNSRRTCFGS